MLMADTARDLKLLQNNSNHLKWGPGYLTG